MAPQNAAGTVLAQARPGAQKPSAPVVCFYQIVPDGGFVSIPGQAAAGFKPRAGTLSRRRQITSRRIPRAHDPRSLKAAGYRTGIIGKLRINPESAFPFDFHEITGANFGRKNLAECARHAEAFFTAGDAPFFLSINYPDAHDPAHAALLQQLQNQLQAGWTAALPRPN